MNHTPPPSVLTTTEAVSQGDTIRKGSRWARVYGIRPFPQGPHSRASYDRVLFVTNRGKMIRRVGSPVEIRLDVST